MKGSNVFVTPVPQSDNDISNIHIEHSIGLYRWPITEANERRNNKGYPITGQLNRDAHPFGDKNNIH